MNHVCMFVCLQISPQRNAHIYSQTEPPNICDVTNRYLTYIYHNILKTKSRNEITKKYKENSYVANGVEIYEFAQFGEDTFL